MRKLLLTDYSFILDLLFNSDEETFNYFYRGRIDYNLTGYLLSLAEAKIKKDKSIKAKTKKRVFHIMVESIQNISKHQLKIKNYNNLSFFAIQKYRSIYFITTGNIIDKKHIQILRNKLDIVNQKTYQELTEYYKKILNDGEFSEKGGAGLGLIEIARKSGNKLKYDFIPIDDNISFFYLHTYINTSDTDVHYIPSVFEFDYIKRLHALLIEQNIVLVFSSVFDQRNLIALISLLNNHLTGGNILIKKRIISSLIELLQNIIKHGKININGKKLPLGIFFINFQNNSICLNTINYIPNASIEEIKNFFLWLNSMTVEELEDYYNLQLFKINDSDEEEKSNKLGLVEIRLKTKGKIYYDIVNLDKEKSILSIQICFPFTEN